MEPLTLYKLMILYLLKAVRYPLTRSQLSDFMLEKEYCNFMTFQQVISELLESHLVREETLRNSSRYLITREGEETEELFIGNISEEILADMDAFLEANKIRLREESGTVSSYEESPSGDYNVNLEIYEGRDKLLSVSLSVPSEDQAEVICNNWKSSDQKVYESIMKELLRN